MVVAAWPRRTRPPAELGRGWRAERAGGYPLVIYKVEMSVLAKRCRRDLSLDNSKQELLYRGYMQCWVQND